MNEIKIESYLSDSLVVTFDSKSYMIKGFNRLLFFNLVYNPSVLIKIIDSSDINKDEFIKNILIVFSNEDRSNYELATIECVKALWSRSGYSGISTFLELLAKKQWVYKEWDGYRDHLRHSFFVYLIGILLIDKSKVFRDILNASIGIDNIDRFLNRWLYASTYHDIGYIFELSDYVENNLNIVNDYISNIFYEHEQFNENFIIDRIGKSGTISKDISAEILECLGIKKIRLRTLEDMMNYLCGSDSIINILDEYAKQTGIGNDGISLYSKYCQNESPEKNIKRKPFVDHGICGAVLMLFIVCVQKSIYLMLNQRLEIDDKKLGALNRNDVLKLLYKKSQQLIEFYSDYEFAASAISLHNIYPKMWTAEKIPRDIDLLNYKISIYKHPLAFLLVLCDSIQGWDRPKYIYNDNKDVYDNKVQYIDINDNGIIIANDDKYNKIVSDLNDVLNNKELKILLKRGDIDDIFSKIDFNVKQDEYIKQLIKYISFNDTLDYLFDVKIISLYEYSERNLLKNNSIQDFVNAGEKHIAIIGEAGSGKSTCLRKYIENVIINKQLFPIFIELAGFSNEDDLIDLSPIKIDKRIYISHLNSNNCCIVLDGYNEIPIEYRSKANRMILRFLKVYDNNIFIISCRLNEMPSIYNSYLKSLSVIPLSSEDIPKYLGKTLGEKKSKLLYTSLTPPQRDICRKPIFLNMLCKLNKESFCAFDTEVMLIAKFLKHIYSTEKEKHSLKIPRFVRDEYLSFMAYKMANERFVISHDDFQEMIAEFYNNNYKNEGFTLSVLIDEVLEYAPLKKVSIKGTLGAGLAFMHQSFQDYYLALAYDKKICDLSEDSFWDKSKLLEWWPSIIYYVGIQGQKGIMLQKLLKSDPYKDQQLILLLLHCIQEITNIDGVIVDEVIIKSLIAFKYGKIPFDYELILNLKKVAIHKRSAAFPERLVEDINWWQEKYARISPVGFDNSLTIRELLSIIDSGKIDMIVDALYTIRNYRLNKSDLDFLTHKFISLYESTTSQAVKEALVMNFGYLQDPPNKIYDLLLNIISSNHENKYIKALSLNALGMIGKKSQVKIIIKYMLDYENPFRDSASWALQRIVKKYSDDVMLIQEVKKVYFRVIIEGPSDIDGRYAKGNQLYSLGELKSNEYLDEILAWIININDPYIIEDCLYSLGAMRSIKALPYCISQLNNSDPLVRYMALYSIRMIYKGRIFPKKYRQYITEMKRDMPFIEDIKSQILDDNNSCKLL